MDRKELLKKIYHGETSNVRFIDFQNLIEGFGFRLRRISGSHHLFKHPLIPGYLNVQPLRGEAKAYQLRQFIRLIEKHHLSMEA
ncbi:MAG: type II toxin-antitoxin system HicA family toxin [Calditrichaeota bacterium]|nr:type II toxin-antitoxin system HicA family toxin [Calditrichota bacterium]